MIGGAGELRRLAMKGVARQADDAEQPGEALPRPLFGPSSAEPCGSASISVTRWPSSPGSGEMQASVVLPTPPFD